VRNPEGLRVYCPTRRQSLALTAATAFGVLVPMRRVGFATSLEPQLIQPVLDTALTYGGLTRHVDAGELIAIPKTGSET
jgi:hypothetical protein